MRKYLGLGAIINKFRRLLIFHYMRMYINILRACLHTFGFGIWFLHYLIKVPAKIIYVRGSMFLDNIFYRGYRRVKIVQPVFIIGHPRSATTFLHTILTQTGEFLTFKQWETNSPALIGRKLIARSRFLQLLVFALFDFRFSPARFKRTVKGTLKGKPRRGGIRGTGTWLADMQGEVSQEEEPIFLNILDTQFLSIVTPIGFEERGYPEICFNDEQPHQERSVRFLEGCFKRQIYYTSRTQILAKMNFSLFRIKTLLKFFPDAKIIHVQRSPIETIRSHLSLHHTRLESIYGIENIPKGKVEQYMKNRYEYNLLFYRYFDKLMEEGVIRKDQILEITYESIKKDLWGTLQQVKDFANLHFSPELEEKLKNQDREQSSYTRAHKHFPLEAFGLTEDKIKSDFDFVFKRHASG